jgi:hypothetical protein
VRLNTGKDYDVFNALQPADLMGLCLYMEARGEHPDGREAVAQVIKNRMKKHNSSVAQVILAKYQFSWLNKDDPQFLAAKSLAKGINKSENPPYQYLICILLASKFLDGEMSSPTIGDATLYFNPRVCNPFRQHDLDPKKGWDSSKCQFVATVGKHAFYREI